MSTKRPTDYTRLIKDGQAPKLDGRTDVSRRWWTLAEKDVGQSVTATVAQLTKQQSSRMTTYAISARLYGNMSVTGPMASALAAVMSSSGGPKDRITYNAIQSIGDTLTARIGETKPRPYYLTSGGSYAQQRKAKRLNQFTDGVFYETSTYDKGLDCFRDSFILGDGFMHVYPGARKLKHERVLANELWVDDEEAKYGFPRNLYRVKDVDREELMERFSDDDKVCAVIAKASTANAMDGGRASDTNSDMVRVIEAWHLANEDENGKLSGGAHAIVVAGSGSDSGVLVRDEWEFDFFPFAKLPWCKRPSGFWSQSLCEQLRGEQIELNKELWFIQRSMQIAGSVKVLLSAGSKVAKEKLDSEVGGVIEYTGEKPEYVTPNPIHPVFFENVNRIIDRMYRVSGASELSASGEKPAGLDSGKALREYQDIESERHRTTSRLNDNFYLAIAALDRVFAPEVKGLKVKVPGRNSFSLVDYSKDIGRIEDEQFVLQCFPVSRLPRDPAGRLQTIQEYIQAGFMTPRQGRRALDFPDFDTIESLANAQEDMLTKVLDGILDDGKYRTPEPTDDLTMAKEMVLEYLQRYRQFDDAEASKLDMLRRWNSQVDSLMKRAMGPGLTALPGGAAPAPGAPPGGGTPQGKPMAAPQSELMPQVAA